MYREQNREMNFLLLRKDAAELYRRELENRAAPLQLVADVGRSLRDRGNSMLQSLHHRFTHILDS